MMRIGRRVTGSHGLVKDARAIVSLGAGMSAAYVFMHVLPGLDVLRTALIESTSLAFRYEGRALYLLALLGFMTFYSLDNVSARLNRSGGDQTSRLALWLNVGGFAAYGWLLSYLLLHRFDEHASSLVLFAVAIAFHLFVVNHGLQARHGAEYERVGRFVIAGMCLLAFVAGAVIMNSAIMELPGGEELQVILFLRAGLVYGLLLLSLH